MITITWTSGSQVFAAGCGTDAVLRMFRGGARRVSCGDEKLHFVYFYTSGNIIGIGRSAVPPNGRRLANLRRDGV